MDNLKALIRDIWNRVNYCVSLTHVFKDMYLNTQYPSFVVKCNRKQAEYLLNKYRFVNGIEHDKNCEENEVVINFNVSMN